MRAAAVAGLAGSQGVGGLTSALAVEWEAPANVGATMSTRAGGVSAAPFDSLNLGDHVGDEMSAVAENRRRFGATVGGRPLWLRQVHGAEVIDAGAAVERAVPQADGAWTDRPGVACVVLVADCLPVLFAARNGRAVGAAHAGWRGLASGVIEQTLAALASAAGCSPGDVLAWIGPGIGPHRFEVGADVVEAFAGAGPAYFVPSARRDGRDRWLGDLPGLARHRLAQAGAGAVTGGHWCTASDASRFFSFRRDGTTGRMAAAVWLCS